MLQDGIRKCTGGRHVWERSELFPRLLALAMALSVEQAGVVAERLAAQRIGTERIKHPAVAVDVATELAEAPDIRALAVAT